MKNASSSPAPTSGTAPAVPAPARPTASPPAAFVAAAPAAPARPASSPTTAFVAAAPLSSGPRSTRLPLRRFLSIAPAQIPRAKETAHRLYAAGRLAEAEIVCRGLIAADDADVYPFVLYVGILFRFGRWADALACAEEGLAVHPSHGRLSGMRAELLAIVHRDPSTQKPDLVHAADGRADARTPLPRQRLA